MPDYVIPKDFPIAEQMAAVEAIYRQRRDFIEGKTRKRNMSEEESNLARYNLALLASVGKTLRSLANGETPNLPADHEVGETGTSQTGDLPPPPPAPTPEPEQTPPAVEEPAAVLNADDHWDD